MVDSVTDIISPTIRVTNSSTKVIAKDTIKDTNEHVIDTIEPINQSENQTTNPILVLDTNTTIIGPTIKVTNSSTNVIAKVSISDTNDQVTETIQLSGPSNKSENQLSNLIIVTANDTNQTINQFKY